MTKPPAGGARQAAERRQSLFDFDVGQGGGGLRAQTRGMTYDITLLDPDGAATSRQVDCVSDVEAVVVAMKLLKREPSFAAVSVAAGGRFVRRIDASLGPSCAASVGS